MSGLVRWPAVARGAALGLAVAVPAIVVAEVIDAAVDIDSESDLVFVFYLAVVAALAVGGWRAAKESPDAPLVHGALGALGAYAVLVVGLAVVELVSGDTVDAVAVVFNGFMAATAGVLGGMVAAQGAGRRGATPD